MELYRAYQEQKRFIPEGNLVEIRFEDVEKDAMGLAERLYRELSLPGWEQARPHIEKYIDSKKNYKKNTYNYDPRTVQLVNDAWGSVLDEWGYDRL